MKADVTCTWIGTAGFLLECEGTTLLADPFLSRPTGVAPFPVARQRLAEVDAILCTHGHFDHAMDLEAVARLSDAPIYAPDVVCKRLNRLGIPIARLHPNERTVEAQVGAFRIAPVPSKHIRYDATLVAATLRNALQGGTLRELVALGLLWPMGSNSDFRIRLAGLSLYLSGSLGQSPERLAQERADVALLPYNGRSDMPAVVLQAARALHPRAMVLHHFDDFYPHFAPAQDPSVALPWLREQLPDVRIHVPEMGAPFSLLSLL